MTIRGSVIAGGLLAGAMGLLTAVGLVLMTVQGEYRLAISLVGATALFLGLSVVSVEYGSDRVRPRVKVDGTGTTLRPLRLIDIPLLIAYVGLAFNIVNTLFAPPGGWFAATWLKVIIGLGWVFFGVAVCGLLWGHFRWGASTYLRLTPTGVEIGQGLRPQSCTWDQIRSVTDRPPRLAWLRFQSLAVSTSGEKTLRMMTGIFTPNGAALRDMVTFYWRHPEFRGELTDGAAPMRLQQSLIRP